MLLYVCSFAAERRQSLPNGSENPVKTSTVRPVLPVRMSIAINSIVTADLEFVEMRYCHLLQRCNLLSEHSLRTLDATRQAAQAG